MENKINLLVRAVIQVDGKFLLCKKKGRDYYFLPGGHVEFGESAKEALKRELKEELSLNIKECFFIGGSEHMFVEDRKKQHEINLAFWVPVKKINTKSKENHLRFFLLSKSEITKGKVYPESLVKGALKWMKNKKTFWVSQF